MVILGFICVTVSLSTNETVPTRQVLKLMWLWIILPANEKRNWEGWKSFKGLRNPFFFLAFYVTCNCEFYGRVFWNQCTSVSEDGQTNLKKKNKINKKEKKSTILFLKSPKLFLFVILTLFLWCVFYRFIDCMLKDAKSLDNFQT